MRSLLSPLIATLAVLAVVTSAHAQTKHIVIVHSNDTHGHLVPYSLPSRVPQGDRTAALPVRKNIGGVARRATVIGRIRAENPTVKCFDAGDNMDGTLFSTEYHDRADYDAISAMHYDYCVTGNHEYSLSATELRELLPTIRAKMLVANVVDRKTKRPIAARYAIDNWDGLRVAVVGLVTAETKVYRAAKEAFDIEDPVAVAKELVPELRKKADLVVLVTHTGVAVDRQIATELPGVDVIVGGHSHTRLPSGIYQQAAHPGARDPKGTIIVQTGAWGGELGRLDLTVAKSNGRWSVSNYHDTLIALTSEIPDDPALASVIDTYWKPLEQKYRDTLGVASADFTDFDGEPSTNYYLVSDACREVGKCQLSLQNLGGVRAPLLQGPVTRYEVASMIPFIDTLYTATIKGSELDSVLNETFAQPSRELHYRIHHWKPDSATRREERWKIAEISLSGAPIHPDSLYTIGCSDFFLRSISKHIMSSRSTGTTTVDALAAYIRQNRIVTPSNDERVSVKEE